MERLGALVRDGNLPIEQRATALQALVDAPGDAATAELVRATACDDLALQVDAAYALTFAHRRADHGDLLVELVAGWPADDVPQRATHIREVLGEDPESETTE